MKEKESFKYYYKKDMDRLRLHFIYVSIILGVLLLLILSYVFFDKQVAWQFLSFAGVALSLVLSVIAILITLIDVAGQKQQVYEIFKSSEELKEVINRQHELITKHAENMDDVDNMIQNAFDNHFNSSVEAKNHEKQKPINENSNSSTSNLIAENGESSITGVSLFLRAFKRYSLNKQLTSKQESKIDEIISQFRTIEVRFDQSELILRTNYLYTTPLVDKEYEKRRSKMLIERYLKEEGLLSST